MEVRENDKKVERVNRLCTLFTSKRLDESFWTQKTVDRAHQELSNGLFTFNICFKTSELFCVYWSVSISEQTAISAIGMK